MLRAGFVYSGVGPDYRVLVKKARKQAQAYFLQYRALKPVKALVQDTASVMQEYTQSGGVRPFGISLLVAGYDDEGPQLFQVDPSGAYYGWKASAIGKNFKNARSFLEKRYNDDVELDDASVATATPSHAAAPSAHAPWPAQQRCDSVVPRDTFRGAPRRRTAASTTAAVPTTQAAMM